jgi:hypothetical protein
MDRRGARRYDAGRSARIERQRTSTNDNQESAMQTLIRRATVWDGTGAAPYHADVLVDAPCIALGEVVH